MVPIPSPFGKKKQVVSSSAGPVEQSRVSKEQRDILARINFVMEQNNIPSYILLFQEKGSKDGMTFHINNTNTRVAMRALVVSLVQVLQIDLDQHPEYSDEYKKIIETLLLDIQNVTAKANEKLKAMRT